MSCNVHIPGEEEMEHIAYLVLKGWRYSKYPQGWVKAGQLRRPTMEEEADRSDYGKEPDLTVWDLWDAYDHQVTLDEAPCATTSST